MNKIILLLIILLSFKGYSQSNKQLKAIKNLQCIQVGSITATAPGSVFTTKELHGYGKTSTPLSRLVNAPGKDSLFHKSGTPGFMAKGITSSTVEKAGSGALYDGPPPPPPFVPYLNLQIETNRNFKRQLTIGFLPKDSDAAEWMTDLKSEGKLPTDASISVKDEQYIMKGTDDISTDILLCIKSGEAALFKFSIIEMVDCPEIKVVYLYDSYDETYHDIKNETYEVLLQPGFYNNRFKISFTSQIPEPENSNNTGFYIYQHTADQTIIAVNPDKEIIESFILYDLYGRVVNFKTNLSDQQEFSFSTSGLSAGIYIAAVLTTDNKRIIKKLYITR